MGTRCVVALVGKVAGQSVNLARFGLLRSRREESVFELHPPAKRVRLLLMAYDKNTRGPFGFHPRIAAETLKAENAEIAQRLLSDIAEPRLTPQDANEILTWMQEKRPSLLDELPKDVYQALLRKAQAAPADSNGRISMAPVMLGRGRSGELILMNPFTG